MPLKFLFRVDPNRGARFGHQFFEVAMLSAWSLKVGGLNLYNKGFSANSASFGKLFHPRDSAADAYYLVDEFVLLQNFNAERHSSRLNIYSS